MRLIQWWSLAILSAVLVQCQSSSVRIAKRYDDDQVEQMLDDDDDPMEGLDSDSAESHMLMDEEGDEEVSIENGSMMISTSHGMSVSSDDPMYHHMMHDHHEHHHKMNSTRHEDRKKKAKGLHDIYMAFMMVKSILSSMMMFLSPVMQMKSFGLSVINTMINVAKFIVYVRNMQGAQTTAAPMPIIPSFLMSDKRRTSDQAALNQQYPTTNYHNQPALSTSASMIHQKYAHPGPPSPITPLSKKNYPVTTYAPHKNHPYRFYFDDGQDYWTALATARTDRRIITTSTTPAPTPANRWGSFDGSTNFVKRSFDLNSN